MEGKMLIGFVIYSAAALIFAAIGLCAWKSKTAVGFFTFVKPPAVKNIKKYNHAVSILWFIFSIVLEIIGIPILFIEQNSPVGIVIPFAVVFLVISMIIAYLRIEAKYKI